KSEKKGSSSSSIDSFLHRLNNDIDLKKMKNRKGSDIDGAPPTSGGGASITNKQKTSSSSSLPKRIILSLLSILILGLLYDTMTSPPEKRILGSHLIHDFLFWVKENPGTGAAAFIFVYGLCVALLLPGTPLTLGGGYVYKVAYGWTGGVAMATFTSMAGSLFGSCSCFILGRYIMRDRVRKWGRKYPLFDAIDIAVSGNGFKIMCLLYLTPILPLGPVSYLVGTTSMPLPKFAAAKIAALPLMLLYVVIGASTDTFLAGGDAEHHHNGEKIVAGEDGGGGGGSDAESVKKIHGVDEETHKKMVFYGLCLSIVSMSLVSHFVKKELYKIFDKQKKDKGERGKKYNWKESSNSSDEQQHVEIVGRNSLLRRPRGHDEEKG
ncbi:hypothetical protein ACHAXR_008561, partial [Thalassiosira sp. AJA248-18]